MSLKLYILLFLISIHNVVVGQSYESKLKIESLINSNINEIEKFNFSSFTVIDYSLILDETIKMINESSDMDVELKGQIILAVLANHTGKLIESKEVSCKDSNMKVLLKKFESQQYYICQSKTPDFIKLVYYTCDGSYGYIYKRFKTSTFYFPFMSILFIIILFTLANLFGIIKWKYRGGYNRLLIVILLVSIVLFLVFKQTCDDCIKADSFYGITI